MLAVNAKAAGKREPAELKPRLSHKCGSEQHVTRLKKDKDVKKRKKKTTTEGGKK